MFNEHMFSTIHYFSFIWYTICDEASIDYTFDIILYVHCQVHIIYNLSHLYIFACRLYSSEVCPPLGPTALHSQLDQVHYQQPVFAECNWYQWALLGWSLQIQDFSLQTRIWTRCVHERHSYKVMKEFTIRSITYLNLLENCQLRWIIIKWWLNNVYTTLILDWLRKLCLCQTAWWWPLVPWQPMLKTFWIVKPMEWRNLFLQFSLRSCQSIPLRTLLKLPLLAGVAVVLPKASVVAAAALHPTTLRHLGHPLHHKKSKTHCRLLLSKAVILREAMAIGTTGTGPAAAGGGKMTLMSSRFSLSLSLSLQAGVRGASGLGMISKLLKWRNHSMILQSTLLVYYCINCFTSMNGKSFLHHVNLKVRDTLIQYTWFISLSLICR